MTHIFSHRLDRRFGAVRDATVAFCGFVAPDVPPGELYPDRDVETMVKGLGQRIADLRAFAYDEQATCGACHQAREGARPGRLRRFWRWLTRTGPMLEPTPDRIVDP